MWQAQRALVAIVPALGGMVGTRPGYDPRKLSCLRREAADRGFGRKFTAFYPFCSSFPHRIRELAFPVLLVFREKTGVEVGLSKRVWPQSISLRLPTLRFRGKIMLGFAVVLAISAASMGIAYLGFERVSAGVALLPQQRVGSRSGAQYRPRADFVPGAGAILCGDRQGRRRQGGAGSRSQPEGRHRSIDEGHHQSGAPRSDHPPGPRIPAPSPRFSPIFSRSSATAPW